MRLRVGLLLWAVSSVSAFAAQDGAATEGVSLTNNVIERKASLLRGVELDSSYKASLYAPLTAIDGWRFAMQDKIPLETGAGIDAGTRPILALLLGLLLGFGLGHLVARDRDGFILFLIVDLVIVVLWGVVGFGLPGFGYGWGLGGLAKVISHIIQGIDAYAEAGGGRLVQWTRENTIEILAARDSREAPATTFRTMAVQF